MAADFFSKNVTPQGSILILGLGNAWATDDGVGPEIVRRVQARWERLERNATGEVGFIIMAQPDLSLLDAMAACQLLIIVDAVVSGAPPGVLHRQLWRDGVLAEKGVARASSHGFGVNELLGMARALGKSLPRVELWGVEIASAAPGPGLTPAVAAAVESIAAQLTAYLLADGDALQMQGAAQSATTD